MSCRECPLILECSPTKWDVTHEIIFSRFYKLSRQNINEWMKKITINVTQLSINYTWPSLWYVARQDDKLPVSSLPLLCTLQWNLKTFSLVPLPQGKILTPYPTTAHGLRCCSRTPCSISIAKTQQILPCLPHFLLLNEHSRRPDEI